MLKFMRAVGKLALKNEEAIPGAEFVNIGVL